jgi:hypothetical protein
MWSAGEDEQQAGAADVQGSRGWLAAAKVSSSVFIVPTTSSGGTTRVT